MLIWQELLANLAVVALSVLGWETLNFRLERLSKRRYDLAFAAVMGVSAVLSMMLAVSLPGGAIFDLRSAMIALAGFFGGPLAAVVAGAIAGAYRLWVGGAGMPAGLAVIAFAAAAGAIGHLLARRRRHALLKLLILSASASLAMLLGILALPAPLGTTALREVGFPVLGLTFAATLISGLIILQGRRLSDERRLMRSALYQSPDLQYIKNTEGQFISVNQHVADFYGFSDPDELRGKTDFDLSPPEHARACFDQERAVLATGRPVREFIEYLPDVAGRLRWYSTSKSVVLGRDGEVIGLTGVTHDITEQKRIQAELIQSRNLLSNALSGMSDGLAMFDADDVLMFCNEQYREIFALTASVRVPGVPLRDILQAVIETGEQLDIPEGEEAAWADGVIATVHENTEREVNLKNGRWVRVRSRRTGDGTSIVTVSDVTQAKLAQQALVTLTDQLKSLAGTDGLTGLPNRRAFDQSLVDALEQSAAARQPLSLLMIDVDHFKSFNDLYGHLDGDACLKALGRCLQRVARKPVEIAARYGGEEFVLILPDTDMDGAYFVAEEIRELLAELAIPHSGNSPGIVTVSIGVGTYPVRETARSAPEILGRADEALYQAKHAGRDRTVIWQPERTSRSSSAA